MAHPSDPITLIRLSLAVNARAVHVAVADADFGHPAGPFLLLRPRVAHTQPHYRH